jgi:hypothetical protein
MPVIVRRVSSDLVCKRVDRLLPYGWLLPVCFGEHWPDLVRRAGYRAEPVCLAEGFYSGAVPSADRAYRPSG